MHIVVLEGSPNTKGSSNLLAAHFIEGAKAAGHSVEVYDLPKMSIHPCTGCIHCGYEGPCAIDDDVRQVRAAILRGDMIVFVTPLYYYGMSAQLKTMIDRFCAFNGSIQRKRLQSVLISAAWNDDEWTFDALEAHYDTLVRYLNLQDRGRILGRGCGSVPMTAASPYGTAAYRLGKSLQ